MGGSKNTLYLNNSTPAFQTVSASSQNTQMQPPPPSSSQPALSIPSSTAPTIGSIPQVSIPSLSAPSNTVQTIGLTPPVSIPSLSTPSMMQPPPSSSILSSSQLALSIPSTTAPTIGSIPVSIPSLSVPSNPNIEPSSWLHPNPNPPHPTSSTQAGDSSAVNYLAQALTELQREFFTLKTENITLRGECDQLKNERRDLQEKYVTAMQNRPVNSAQYIAQWAIQTPGSVSPSDSISQQLLQPPSSTGSVFSSEQPLLHPEIYPPSVIWTLKDCLFDPDIKLSKGNERRPHMYYCIRKENGDLISPEQWHAVRVAARAIVREVLDPLKQTRSLPGCKPTYGKKYFSSIWPAEWKEAVRRLEQREPLLRLCAQHWKAEHLLCRVLESQKASARAGTSASRGDTVSTDSDEDDPPPPPSTHVPSSPRAGEQSSKSKGKNTRSKSNRGTSTSSDQASIGNTSGIQSSQSLGKRPAAPTVTVPTKKRKAKERHTLPAETSTNLNVASIKGISNSNTVNDTNVIDVSGIQVEPSYETLKAIFTDDPVFQNVPHSLDVLNKLTSLPSGEPPSLEMRDFLLAIETADPNASDANVDAINQSWGHQQFRSGVKRFDNLSWDDIMTSTTGFRLLAATIRTCRVSRHLCSKRGIRPHSYLADMYLQEILKNLWKHWEHCEPSPNQSYNAGEASQSDVVMEDQEKKRLQPLHVSELKQLVQQYGIEVPKNKKTHLKEDYMNAILSSSVELPKDEIDEILRSRKEKSKTPKK